MTEAQHSSSADHGTALGVFAGPIRSLRSPREPGGIATAWRSAILKTPLTAPTHVGALGLHGDAQKEKKHHGGPMKAVLVYAASHYASWTGSLAPHAALHADTLRQMSPAVDASVYGYGAFGENLTVDGLAEHSVFLGDVWQIGGCRLQITEPRGPCATLTRRWMRPALLNEVKSSAAAGWYNAVIEEGPVAPGDTLSLVTRVQDDFSVERVFHLLEQRTVPRAEAQALHDAPFIHGALRARLARRLSTAGRTRP